MRTQSVSLIARTAPGSPHSPVQRKCALFLSDAYTALRGIDTADPGDSPASVDRQIEVLSRSREVVFGALGLRGDEGIAAVDLRGFDNGLIPPHGPFSCKLDLDLVCAAGLFGKLVVLR